MGNLVHKLFRIYLIGAYIFSLIVFFVISFVVNLSCWMLVMLPGSRKLQNPLRSLLQLFYRVWAWSSCWLQVLKLKTPERTQWKNENGEIWVMNHPSILDISYLIKFISNGTCIYKESIGGNPFYGATGRLANYIPNWGGPDMIRLACEALSRGEDLIVFPEGTRSTHMQLDDFKPGFALIAKRSKARINVLWSDAPEDFMTKGISMWKVPELPAMVSIRQIDRIEPAGRSTHSILNAVKQSYRNQLER